MMFISEETNVDLTRGCFSLLQLDSLVWFELSQGINRQLATFVWQSHPGKYSVYLCAIRFAIHL
jgi:hypothetical protein